MRDRKAATWALLRGLPAVLMVGSGLVGGAVSVNYVGFTAFLFPLALGLVILPRDLSRIEVVLRRGAYALSSLLLAACVYGLLSTPVQASAPVVPASERSQAQGRVADIATEPLKKNVSVPHALVACRLSCRPS